MIRALKKEFRFFSVGAEGLVPFPCTLFVSLSVAIDGTRPPNDGQTETFETEHRLMDQMGMHPAYFLDSASGFLMVGVVKNKACIFGFVVGTQMNTVPELRGYVPQCLAPVNVGIFHKAIEDILAGLDKSLEHAVLMTAPSVLYSEAGEEKQDLEHGQQRIDAVTPARDRKRVSLGHPDMGKAQDMLCIAAVISEFLKNVLISERNGVILYIDMALS